MWTPQRREVIALVAMLDLATGGPRAGWVKTQAIAERHHIPLAFLEQIAHRLCQEGLLGSRRGPSGGLRLARAPSAIRVGEILRAVSTREPVEAAAAPRDLEQLVTRSLAAANVELAQALDALTLERLCEDAERLGLSIRPKTALSFDI